MLVTRKYAGLRRCAGKGPSVQGRMVIHSLQEISLLDVHSLQRSVNRALPLVPWPLEGFAFVAKLPAGAAPLR